jgi:hypothetical protein
MSENSQPHRLTARERRNAQLLRWAPWLAFFAASLSPPLSFLTLSLSSSQNAQLYLLLAFASFPFSLLAGLIVAIALLVYRRHWASGLRERLAADGVTADELGWFSRELTRAEKRALKLMDRQNPLLADAYRETLALRLTASRVVRNTRRDLLQIERRIKRAAQIRSSAASVLMKELTQDRERLQRIKQEGLASQAEVEARLQTIEAAASRGASWAETSFMLGRLDEGNKHSPLALESARAEQEVREETERLMRESRERISTSSHDREIAN